jgi:poly-gamma-glutamate capsule biosynthesis protein CapA/YwtB (metallophosphatase superfamily)
MRGTSTLALVAVLALPSFAAAQSMAELAAREREKRKTQKPTTKVLTEEDLRRGSAGRGTVNTGMPEPATAATAAPGAGTATAAAAAPGTQKPKTEEELRAEQEQAWRERLKKAQAEVQRVSQALDAVNRSLADMTGNLYGAQRTTLLGEADKLKIEQQVVQQQLTAVEEEGRRSRFRP